MFYYPNVLNHRTGCFAIIWLAATKARKMNRRDLLKVNIQSTCTDIMNYVLVRVPPLAAGLPRPRFSLYLSSQLQYGVVLVFHRQCQLLLEEIQEAIDRLHRYRVQLPIDMLPEEIRQTQTLPDALALLTESEGAQDPFFGSMEFGMPSPRHLMQLAQEMGVVTPESLLSPRLEGITASQESITMTEREPVIMHEPEFEGAELQEIDMIEMLLEQSDQFPEGEEEREREAEQARQRERREREGEREEVVEQERAAAEIERTRDLTGSTLLMEQAQSTEVTSRDIVSVPEEVELPAVMPEPDERERTPEPVPIPPSPPSPERRERRRESPHLEELVPIPEAPVERQTRRKRQLVFMDEDIQISQEALQAQINDPSIETKSLTDVLIRPPSQVSKPKVLLSNPCMSLPADILELWKQGAVIHHIRRSKRHREVEDEDLEAVRERERGREEQEEGELREIPTEIVESGVSRYDTPVSSLVMEVTDKEISPVETPETRRSPVPVSVCGLEDIPEERVPELEDVMMDVDPLRRMAAIGEDEVTFHSLLPPRVRRRTIAQAFWRLLERIDMKEVAVRQDEPYGDIIISVIQQPRLIETPLA